MHKNSIFGSNISKEEADIHILPVPWDVTTSFRRGTAYAPHRIQRDSSQVDTYHPVYTDASKKRIFLLDPPSDCHETNVHLSTKAKHYIQGFENEDPVDLSTLKEINDASESLINNIESVIKDSLKAGKFPILLGGDHSISLGAIKALQESNYREHVGILQLDAHMDLRHTYQGFAHSHASVMGQAIQLPYISQLVQVGVRDFCEEEVLVAQHARCDVISFTDGAIKENLYMGDSWHDLCLKMIEPLPKDVYLSLDIDVLTPSLCPHTGTPVPGGLDHAQVIYLIEKLVQSGRRVLGMDLVEVGDDPFDCTIAMHLLYQTILRVVH